MTSTTAFALLVLLLLAVLIGLELRRRSARSPLGSTSLRSRLSGSGPSDPDGRRIEHDLSAIAAHGQSPFVR